MNISYLKNITRSFPFLYFFIGAFLVFVTYSVGLFLGELSSSFLYITSYTYPLLLVSLGLFGIVIQAIRKTIVYASPDSVVVSNHVLTYDFYSYCLLLMKYSLFNFLPFICIFSFFYSLSYDSISFLIIVCMISAFIVFLCCLAFTIHTFNNEMKPVFNKDLIKIFNYIQNEILNGNKSTYFIVHSLTVMQLRVLLKKEYFNKFSHSSFKKIVGSGSLLLIENNEILIKHHTIHFKNMNIKISLLAVMDYCIDNNIQIKDLTEDDLSLIEMIGYQ